MSEITRNNLDIVVRELKGYYPVSVFIFGSRARNDNHERSDWEIGVIFDEQYFLSKETLDALVSPPENIHLYPYRYNILLEGKIEAPFPQAMFLTEILLTGKTIYGKKVVETLPLPLITPTDLLEEINFSLARATDAIVAYQNKNEIVARKLFWKSCLFGTRALILLYLKRFPCDYKEIVELSTKVGTEREIKIVMRAYQARNQKIFISVNMLYQNLFYLTSIREIIYSYSKIISYLVYIHCST